jgi:rod shape-determining protein MreC
MTWAHPEFRVSAFTVEGNAYGIVAPVEAVGGGGALEFRGVPYRDSVRAGTLVLSSGLGGVYPKGIPVGFVLGLVREQSGWERVYRLRPAANPAAAAHVLILTSPKAAGDLAAAFPSDSMLQALRLDSIARVRREDSLAAARADSVRTAAARSLSDTVRRAAPPRPVAPGPRPAPAAGDKPSRPPVASAPGRADSVR